MADETSNSHAPGTPDAPSLERVVLALQKTFSRVSAQTARVEERRARAMVTGTVAFSMRLGVAMDDDDRLLATPGGPISMELNGTLDTDVRVREDASDT
jgi:hypothetical protein